jgi:hypothetical protein
MKIPAKKAPGNLNAYLVCMVVEPSRQLKVSSRVASNMQTQTRYVADLVVINVFNRQTQTRYVADLMVINVYATFPESILLYVASRHRCT